MLARIISFSLNKASTHDSKGFSSEKYSRNKDNSGGRVRNRIKQLAINLHGNELNKSVKIKGFKNQLREARKLSKKNDSKKIKKPPGIKLNYRGMASNYITTLNDS